MSTTNFEKLLKGDEFTWGRIIKIHEIESYAIVEYLNDQEEIFFHPYLNRKDLMHGFDSLEEAIVFAIAAAKEGTNSRAAKYFIKMIS